MKQKNKRRTLFVCQAAVIAALYVVLTLLAKALGLADGVIQIRFSEMLCLLPLYLPAAIPGVTLGCFLSALLTGAVWLDLVVGTAATFLGAIGTYWLRKNKWLAAFPPVFFNALLIPFVLAYGYGAEEALLLMMLTVGLGEALSVYGLGMLMLHTAGHYLERLGKNYKL